MADLLDQIFAEDLGGKSGPHYNVSYGLTTGNRDVKIYATPNLFGRNPAVVDYIPAAVEFTKAIEEMVATTRSTLDIATLAPFPDDRFLDALQDGITSAAEEHRF